MRVLAAVAVLAVGIAFLLCVGPVLRDTGGLVSPSYRVHQRLPVMRRLYRTFDTYRYVVAVPFLATGGSFVILGVVLGARALL
jgi:hypothetical protein